MRFASSFEMPATARVFLCQEELRVNILVCMKQVPDTTAKKQLGDDFRLNRASLDTVMNPFDEYALEEAIRLKEAQGGEVTMLTMGLPSAEETMRKALAMGADKGILISDPALGGTDTWGTATVLAAAARSRQFDLILCGQESADARTGLLPAALAEALHVPLLSYAQKLDIDAGHVTIQREITGGYQVVTADFPAVVMVVKAINEPRYPSLKGIMAAKRKEITILGILDLGVPADNVGLAGSKTEVISSTPRPEKTAGQVVSEPDDVAARLIADFLAESKVIA
jgi:electron transfer flavoprotein beta subunit